MDLANSFTAPLFASPEYASSPPEPRGSARCSIEPRGSIPSQTLSGPDRPVLESSPSPDGLRFVFLDPTLILLGCQGFSLFSICRFFKTCPFLQCPGPANCGICHLRYNLCRFNGLGSPCTRLEAKAHGGADERKDSPSPRLEPLGQVHDPPHPGLEPLRVRALLARAANDWGTGPTSGPRTTG